MKIQWTKVLDQQGPAATVELLIADAPTVEAEEEYLLLRVRVTVDVGSQQGIPVPVPTFAELQRAALVRWRELTSAQSQALLVALGPR
jgi:hypothetical protein